MWYGIKRGLGKVEWKRLRRGTGRREKGRVGIGKEQGEGTRSGGGTKWSDRDGGTGVGTRGGRGGTCKRNHESTIEGKGSSRQHGGSISMGSLARLAGFIGKLAGFIGKNL